MLLCFGFLTFEETKSAASGNLSNIKDLINKTISFSNTGIVTAEGKKAFRVGTANEGAMEYRENIDIASTQHVRG